MSGDVSPTPATGAAQQQDYDPHRFDVERTRRKSNVFPKIVFGFVVTLAIIGGTAYFIKTKISNFMQARNTPTTVERELKVDDKPPETRRFEDIVRPVVTPLPATVPAPIPVVTAASGVASAPPATVEPPSMMLGGPTVSEPPPSEPPRMRTIEAYGEQVADGIKTPTTTPQVSARKFGDRSYLLARGSFIPCVLETQLISTVSGSSNCVVPEHVYSENGRVLLIEKGSKIIGEYKSDVKQGDVRIAIIWQRIKTPTGVVIDVDSPTTDAVGAMGVQGGIDYHWPQRIGAAVLLSLIGDAIDLEKSQKSEGSFTVVNAQGTGSTTKSLAEKVLESTINIPPTISKNRGDRVTVYLNRDLWFNTVYTHAEATSP
ncbi:MAG: type IV secretion system protein VirB10 [Rhizobacter sp.]